MSQEEGSAYDVSHHLILDILLFLFLYVFIIGYVHTLYGEKQIDVLRTSMQLDYAFTRTLLQQCFSDPHTLRFTITRFTSDVLKQCTPHQVRATLEDLDSHEKTVLGDPVSADLTWREYVSYAGHRGVLTFEMESF